MTLRDAMDIVSSELHRSMQGLPPAINSYAGVSITKIKQALEMVGEEIAYVIYCQEELDKHMDTVFKEQEHRIYCSDNSECEHQTDESGEPLN